jgi:hypothetical protein
MWQGCDAMAYHPISPEIWDRRFRKLSPNAKVLAFYVFSAPRRSSEGLYRCPIGYMVGDTGLSEDDVVLALTELEAAGYIEWDEEHETLLDRFALKRNPLRNGRDKKTGAVKPDLRIKPALKRLEAVADSLLFSRFVQLAQTFSPDLATAIWEELPSYITDAIKGPPEGARDAPTEAPIQGPSREERSSYEESRVESSTSRDARAIALLQERCNARTVGSFEGGVWEEGSA